MHWEQWDEDKGICRGCQPLDSRFNYIESQIRANGAHFANRAELEREIEINDKYRKIGDTSPMRFCDQTSMVEWKAENNKEPYFAPGDRCLVVCNGDLKAYQKGVGAKFAKCNCSKDRCYWSYGGKNMENILKCANPESEPEKFENAGMTEEKREQQVKNRTKKT